MERASGIALWRQIAQAIESDIAGGAFAPGSQLPTEAKLAERFGVNRHTLRRAIGHLQDLGLVHVEQGRGTFVSGGRVDLPLNSGRGKADQAQNSRMLRGELLRANSQIARNLGIEVGAKTILIELLSLRGNKPLTVTAHYFAGDRFDGLIEAFEAEGSLHAALARFGVKECTPKRTKVTARMPSAADARVLHMPRSQPLVVSESVILDTEGQPVEFSVSRSAGQRMQFVIEQ